jgi:hypothetical protein
MKVDEDEIEHIYLDDEDEQPRHAAPHAHSHAHAGGHAVETKEEYRKFYKVIFGIFAVATLLSLIRGWDINRAMADFMAVFFITFAAFKFQNIEEFAHTYRTYDLLASRIRPWGYIYPFIEAFLGFWYLLSSGPTWLNLLTIAVTGTAAYGVYKTLQQKRQFHCACLGTFIKLPLSKITLTENLTMMIMAAFMLFL